MKLDLFGETNNRVGKDWAFHEQSRRGRVIDINAIKPPVAFQRLQTSSLNDKYKHFR